MRLANAEDLEKVLTRELDAPLLHQLEEMLIHGEEPIKICDALEIGLARNRTQVESALRTIFYDLAASHRTEEVQSLADAMRAAGEAIAPRASWGAERTLAGLRAAVTK